MSMGVYKVGKQWYGRWTVGGRRVKRSLGAGVRTKAQAEKLWAEVEHQRVMGNLGVLDPSPVTLGRLRAEFLDARAPHLAPKTLARYDVALRMLARTFGDGCLLRGLTTRKLSAWAGSRLADGVSPAGVNCDLRHIRAALNWAADHEMIERAPRVHQVKAPRALPRHLTVEQVEALLRASPPDLRRLWAFLVWTGMRRAEAHALRWEDINWETHPVALVRGKGDKERGVPLLPLAVAALADLPAPDGECCPWPRRIGRIWPDVGIDVLTKWFKRCARAAGLEEARLHDLRHTAITYMISRGVPVRMVQDVAGHASVTTTEGYARVVLADLYEVMARGL
ncbi:MAG: site-specific integrase [Deltaproteobacteria bacterium]|nr:site-specific integrase [Deltaproteobacteria bacterium]